MTYDNWEQSTPPSWIFIIAVGFAAMALSICSVLLSTSFGFQLGTNLALQVVFAVMLASIAIAEFFSANVIRNGYQNKKMGSIITGLWCLVGGVGFSIIAGQASIQKSIDEHVSQRRMASDAYQAALKEREIARQKASSLAVSESEYSQASQMLSQLRTQKETFENEPAQNSNDNNAGFTIGSKVIGQCDKGKQGFYQRKYCQTYTSYSSQIELLKVTIARWQKYQAALDYANMLESKTLPTATKEAQLPGIVALSLVLGVAAEKLGATVFLSLAIFCELTAVLLWGLWGDLRQQAKMYEEMRKHVFTRNVSPPEYKQHTQSVTSVSLANTIKAEKKEDKQVVSEHTQNTNWTEKLVNTFDAIKKDLQNKALNNLSFQNLQKRYKVNQKEAKSLREALVTSNFARYDDTRKLVII